MGSSHYKLDSVLSARCWRYSARIALQYGPPMTNRRQTAGRSAYMPQFMRVRSIATHQPSSAWAITRWPCGSCVVRCSGMLSVGSSTTTRRQHTASQIAQCALPFACLVNGVMAVWRWEWHRCSRRTPRSRRRWLAREMGSEAGNRGAVARDARKNKWLGTPHRTPCPQAEMLYRPCRFDIKKTQSPRLIVLGVC